MENVDVSEFEDILNGEDTSPSQGEIILSTPHIHGN